MKRRFLNLILVMLMVVCVLPFAASAAACEECDYSVLIKTTVPATCESEGQGVYKCSVCPRQTTNKPIPKLPHTVEVLPAQAATCTKTGLSEGSKCSVCEEVLTKQMVIPKLPHDHSVFVSVYQKPTCTEGGLDTYKCKTCPQQTKKATPALGHTAEVVPAVAATCTKTGLSEGSKCSVCEEILTAQETIAKLAHKHTIFWGYEGLKEPTCDEGAVEVWICEICNKNQKHVEVAKLGHDEEVLDEYRAPSCDAVGCSKFKCKRCSLEVIRETPALGHTEEVVPAVPATCTSTGLTEGKKCSVCGETLLAQEVTDKLAHEFTVSVPGVEATCTADGYTAHKKCANCDATEGKEELDTDGHIFENYICKVCGTRDGSCEHKNRVMKYTAPTCSDKGSQSMWCPDCNYETMDILDEIPHTPKDLSVAPSCSTPGKKHVICAVCNVNIEGPIVLDATNEHTNVNGICSVCGASVCDHSDTTTTTTPSTCAVAGTRTVTCNSCGKVTKTELPLAAHKHVNGICSVCGHRDSDKITFDFQDIHIVGGSAY